MMVDLLSQIISFFMAFYFAWEAPVHTPTKSCGEFQEFEYCDFGGGDTNSRVLFVFNGLGHDATSWSRNPIQGKIEAYWKTNGIPRPRVITIGKHRLWWYTDISEGQKLNALVDHLEKTFDLKNYTEHFVYGDSMGGHNAYRWVADFPDQFSALALSCPAMPLSFVKKREHVGVWGMNSFADAVISGHYAQAASKMNPIAKLEASETVPHVPKIFIATANQDQLGFYSGSRALAEALRNHTRSQVTFEEHNATHCHIDPSKLAEFLGK